MLRVYAAGGVYVLNLHPERGALARPALDRLLATAGDQPLPVWIARLGDIAAWWRERASARLSVTSVDAGRWRVTVAGAPRATLVARNTTVADAQVTAWPDGDLRIVGQQATVESAVFPGVGLSPHTPADVEATLREQGYPVARASADQAGDFAVYVDRPEGLGATRRERQELASALVATIERGVTPLVRIGPWPDGKRAGLSITGDVDSVTIQDFFLRIVEVRRYTPTRRESPAPATVQG